MAAQLTDELRQALARQPNQNLEVEDPLTQQKYVLLPLAVYERLQRSLLGDDRAADPREFYRSFAEAAQADIDAPGMELYDDYDANRKPS